MVMFKVNDTLIVKNFSFLTLKQCRPCPIFALYILAFALQLKVKAWKTPQGG
jgi:hypothetical protein